MINYRVSGKILLKNTLFLYFRQLLTLFISLFTVRITLDILGAVDYGLNSVVAGTVTMFSFISGSMAEGAQRYFSFFIGEGSCDKLKDSFKATFSIFVLITIGIFISEEIIGLWFLNNKLVIPLDRRFTSQVIFQFAVLGSCASVMVTPYMSSVIAHENMKLFAKIGVAESFLKLAVVVLLYLAPNDKLIAYGFLYMLVNFGKTAFYFFYTTRKYEECTSSFLWKKNVIKEILFFNVWNSFGSFAWMMKTQGLALVLNMFFGPVVNAAQQIGNQIRNISVIFSQNFSMAAKPQIIKSFAASDYDHMIDLVFKASKINFFLLLLITVPTLFSLDFILELWLVDVPQHAAVFCQLLLIDNLIESLSLPFAVVNQATGKIALYQFLIGSANFLNIPISYYLFYLGFEPKYAFIVGIIMQICIVVIRICLIPKVQSNLILKIILKIVLPCSLITFIAYVLSKLFWCTVDSFEIFLFETICQVFLILFLSFIIGLDKNERQFVLMTIKKRLNKNVSL